ncbi:MAG TPA: COX15/CtaA family protein [Nocardioidaceae bacterium]|nr:COX15/CtaA family protein [Nocardioidaceae bacterium]
MQTAQWLRPLGVATLLGNIGIVVTGGAVRLSGSGLGCPTWPRCTEQSFVPHGELGLHGAIEFGNRMMTFVLVAVAVATWVAAMRYRPRHRTLRVLATVLALGIPGQAVIGGVTVLTDLNPWIVSLHLMLSMAMIALSVLFLRMVYNDTADAGGLNHTAAFTTGHLLSRVAVAILVTTFVVLYLGTVVTGAGPHAGHLEPEDLAGDRVFVVRNGLDPQVVSHVHAAAVYLLVALTLVALVAAYRLGAPRDVRRAAVTLLAVEVAQGAVGFTQYVRDLPVLLVGLHLLGAALLTASATWLLVSTRAAAPGQVNSGSIATARNSSAR